MRFVKPDCQAGSTRIPRIQVSERTCEQTYWQSLRLKTLDVTDNETIELVSACSMPDRISCMGNSEGLAEWRQVSSDRLRASKCSGNCPDQEDGQATILLLFHGFQL